MRLQHYELCIPGQDLNIREWILNERVTSLFLCVIIIYSKIPCRDTSTQLHNLHSEDNM